MFKTSKEINHPEVGLVRFKKNPRSKRITLRVKMDKSILVTLPKYSSFRAAQKVLDQNIDWIKKQLTKATQSLQSKILTFEDSFQVRTKKLVLLPTAGNKATLERFEKRIEIKIPAAWELKSEATQAIIQKAIVEALRIEGKIYLINRTRYLAQEKGIQINDIRIKKVKTRWGSCSSKGNINLSLFLMLLSDDLIDYVICHELAHIKHQNHSPAFWNHLEQLLPGAKVLDKQMNQQRHPF